MVKVGFYHYLRQNVGLLRILCTLTRTGPFCQRLRIFFILILPGALVFLNGCRGSATTPEKHAREELKAVGGIYRPENSKPVLPSLREESGLADLMQYALLNNPNVESAFYEWKGAVEAITTARSLPDPMLTFGAEISRGVPALSAALMTDPMANWPGPGKLPLRADAAYEEAQKKRASFEGEMLAAALAVKRAYYQLWVAQEQVRWTQKTLAVLDEMENLARERLTVGEVTQQDVLRAQMERNRLKTELANLEDFHSSIMVRLRSAMGIRPGQTLPAFTIHLTPTSADFTEQSLLEVAFERNPRLKEMRSEVLQAVALFHLAQKSSVPDYSFGVGVSGGMGPVAVSPSFGITLPIWRDKIAAEIAQGWAGVKAAQARLSAEELDLAVRFAETAFAWREADRNVHLYNDNLLPKAKALLESALAGYTGGVSGFLDLLEAERTLLDYHVNQAMAVGQRELVLAEMSLIILGRWPEGVRTILPPEQHAGVGSK